MAEVIISDYNTVIFEEVCVKDNYYNNHSID